MTVSGAPAISLSLDELERLAHVFDDISAETGAAYSAAAFVTWARRELGARRLSEERQRARGFGTAATTPDR